MGRSARPWTVLAGFTWARLAFLLFSAANIGSVNFASAPASRLASHWQVAALDGSFSKQPSSSSTGAAASRTGLAVLSGVLVSATVSAGALRGRQLSRVKAHASGSLEAGGLNGKWGCVKTEGDIDAYWKACGLPWLARKGLQLMDWGAGKNQNVREFTQTGNDIKMDYSFTGPGLGGLGFTETYTVGKGVQDITRMGGAKILVDPIWDGSALVITNALPAKQTEGWAKGLLGGQSDDSVTRNQAGDKDGAASSSEKGSTLDVHRFYMDDSEKDTLVLEADSTPSGGPVVKWFLRKLS
eukprot:TRINITY_DN58330_c0_g1_i1.p1 TRINITY_DN58330_c0_g1~~TRINITY_DN58330_c0_g1_i1.p1  ORF type:complete len:298 (+),score=46.18 TRINITY_DN58330_c0_g1_i1:30-923(+)